MPREWGVSPWQKPLIRPWDRGAPGRALGTCPGNGESVPGPRLFSAPQALSARHTSSVRKTTATCRLIEPRSVWAIVRGRMHARRTARHYDAVGPQGNRQGAGSMPRVPGRHSPEDASYPASAALGESLAGGELEDAVICQFVGELEVRYGRC